MASTAYNFPPYHNEDNSGVVNLVGGTVGSGAIPKGSASSKITFGAGFPAGVTVAQTIIPVITAAGMIVGFFPIASHTFTGAETTYALASGTIPVTSVALPPKNKTSIIDENRQQYFVAAMWPEGPGTVGPTIVQPANPSNPSQTITSRDFSPWRGYPEFVDGAKPKDVGYYSWWSMPATLWFHHFGRGTYLEGLTNNMNIPIPLPDSGNPPNPVTPQTLRWACTANKESLLLDCAYLDFNWVTEFKLVYQPDPNQIGNGTIPMSISVTSNPAGGFFKASVVQAAQTIIAGGGVVFDTIRILRLEDPTAGNYTFNFSISASQNGQIVSVPAVLTLTVV